MKKISILLLIPILNFSQLSNKINTLYKELSEADKVEAEFIGFGMEQSKVYKLFSKLNISASDKEVEYMAYHGNAVVKTYASYIAFDRKYISLKKLFEYYLKNNTPVKVTVGCTGYTSYIADELYKHTFYEKEKIERAITYKHYKDSIISTKNPEPGLLFVLNQLDKENEKDKTNWTEPEIDSLLVNFDQLILNNESSPQNLIEIITEANYHAGKKRPYYQKLIYFDRKYNSDIIKKYLKFCSN